MAGETERDSGECPEIFLRIVRTYPQLLLLCLLLDFSGVRDGRAAMVAFGPYEPDDQTLHLWHLDESKPPFADAVEEGTPLLGLFNGARPGQPSLPLLGKSISFHAAAGGTAGASDFKGAVLTAAPRLHNGKGDNAPVGFRYFGPDGAFTFEMVVKLDQLPHEAPGIALDLLTMEGDGSDRVFAWKIEKEGFLVFIPLPHCGASGGAIA
ncbi:MAG: hypothetical protein RLZZ214_1662, partial [Verrucomicrobiota bacterium]